MELPYGACLMVPCLCVGLDGTSAKKMGKGPRQRLRQAQQGQQYSKTGKTHPVELAVEFRGHRVSPPVSVDVPSGGTIGETLSGATLERWLLLEGPVGLEGIL